MDSHDVENYFRQHRKTLAVVFLMVGMLAVSGFFMGMRQTEQPGDAKPIPGSRKSHGFRPRNSRRARNTRKSPRAAWLANRDWKFTLADLPRAVSSANRPSRRH